MRLILTDKVKEFNEALHNLVESGLVKMEIKDGETVYKITDKGKEAFECHTTKTNMNYVKKN
jgi:predicted transcriptional regulator